jgi:melanoma-associated antigen
MSPTADLRSHLKRLRLDYGANVPVGAQATHRALTIESFLSQAQRAGYLDQSRIGTEGGAKRGGGKRGRNAATDDDNVQYEWRWGPRAHAEIGEAGIGKFLAEFMAERSAEDDDQDDEDMDAGERQEAMRKKIEKRFRGIETAAGGTLNEVR